MLKSLEWIIPEKTKDIMSVSEWLMLVLSIYFHDVGMLVTKSEYQNRNDSKSGFKVYCEDVIFAGQLGVDYKSKLEEFSPDARDRYLYQEYVRSKHAERIRAWIIGEDRCKLGMSSEINEMLDKLFQPFDDLFRRDLATICESHNSDDLSDVSKYKLSQAYGQTDQEVANLQYCAIILRTADLLHITSDRTPSVQFHLINPSDPISQSEWAKQKAVRRVCSKISCDKEGVQNEELPRDTIEVHAYFKTEEGFFGLTSYLNYVKEQLTQSYEWVLQANKQGKAKHSFPWRYVDDSNIEAEGFIKEAFEFKIDQTKILDLLTGHTLYNDTNVVLRELVQNSIDAIRLYFFESDPLNNGLVRIKWDSHSRILSVQDNGTGMTQEIINNFLLRVGSSRYNDPEFIKKNPNFHSISRFGIGVLSSFMISDEVDIVTCHEEEDKARRLMLRSVHGKYLISLLEKNSHEVGSVGFHGTRFSLRIRPSVDMSNILDIARYWFVKPDCKVILQIDEGVPCDIGYKRLSDALRDALKSIDFNFYEDGGCPADKGAARIKFVDKTEDGVTLAYALRYNEYFNEWSFFSLSRFVVGEQEIGHRLGTCVEGIKVANGSPGYVYPIILSIANVCGAKAPKTNVARSGLEMTSELEKMLFTVYSLYVDHITTELGHLVADRAYSITRAAGEAFFLAEPLIETTHSYPGTKLNEQLLNKALSTIPCMLVEVGGVRKTMALDDVLKFPEFWTINSPFLNSAETLISQVSSDVSLSSLMDFLKVNSDCFPDEPVVRVFNNKFKVFEMLFDSKEISSILIDDNNRRLDLLWVSKGNNRKWLDVPEAAMSLLQAYVKDKSERAYHDLESSLIDIIPNCDISVQVPSSICFFFDKQ